MTPHHTAPSSLGGWDRLAIALLGSAAFAQSFDALRQMAAAVHVRSQLTWLFPLLVDGFIAYGIRALLVLRNSRLRARAYVWLLVGGATVTSVWANALHAVRLNQQHHANPDLRLGDIAVAVLSTVAPIAIAGAVHLYILITRETAMVADESACRSTSPAPSRRSPQTAVSDGVPAQRRSSEEHPDADSVDRPSALGPALRGTVGFHRAPDSVDATEPVNIRPVDSPDPPSDRPTDLESVSAPTPAPAPPNPSAPSDSAEVRSPTAITPSAVRAPSEATRQSSSAADPLLVIARTVPLRRGRPSRHAVATTIRRQGLTVSNGRLNELMAILRSER